MSTRAPARPAIWAALRKAGGGTIPGLAAETGIKPVTVRAYLCALERADFVTRTTEPGQATTQHFQLRQDAPQEPPKLRPDGTTPAVRDAKDRMWRSAKMLKTFTLRDLGVASSLPGDQVTYAEVAAFVGWLVKAGYIAVQRKPAGRMPGLFRFLRSTGPKPPHVRKGNQEVFDPNLGKVVWRKPEKAVRDAA